MLQDGEKKVLKGKKEVEENIKIQHLKKKCFVGIIKMILQKLLQKFLEKKQKNYHLIFHLKLLLDG